MGPASNIVKNISKIIITIWFSVGLKSTLCSVVIDGMETNRVKISDYCPKTPHCEEGSHVICMFYNPNKIEGPDCAGFMNISMNADFAVTILELVNTIRAKVALGKVMLGKDGEYLPRGYGLMRLKWDSELATFAQVFANQCHKKGDFCRASNKFPNPSQNIGLIRFSLSDWSPITSDVLFEKIGTKNVNARGLNKEKILYMVYKTLETWYNSRNLAEPSVFVKYPDFTVNRTYLHVKKLANLLSGSATHMGCGMQAFSQYTHHNNSKISYNFIMLVCNLSGSPRPGRAVYETEPPTQVGYTIRCGCPPGYEEDEDCLCYEGGPFTPDSHCDGFNRDCKPSVVLLPIVTAEDAPPALARRGKSFPMMEHEAEKGNSIFGKFEDRVNAVDNEPVTYLPTIPYIETKPRIMDVKKRYFDNKRQRGKGYASGRLGFEGGRLGHVGVRLGHHGATFGHLGLRLRQEGEVLGHEGIHLGHEGSVLGREGTRLGLEGERLENEGARMGSEGARLGHVGGRLGHDGVQLGHQGNGHKTYDTDKPGDHPPVKRKSPHYARKSIFSRIPRFQLSSNHIAHTTVKADVQPRKDFTNIKMLLDDYLKRRKGSDKIKPINESSQVLNGISNKLPHQENDDLNKYFKNKFNYQGMSINNGQSFKPMKITTAEESDRKLMNLLDTLEREVNHIELNKNEKEIFDAKIRKIYGHVVGKSDAMKHKSIADIATENDGGKKDDFTKYEIAVNNHLAKENFDPKHFVENTFLPKTRPQKNLSFLEGHNVKETLFSSTEHELKNKPNFYEELVGIKRRNLKDSNYQSSPNKLPFEFKHNHDEHHKTLYPRKSYENGDSKGSDNINSKYYKNRRYPYEDDKNQLFRDMNKERHSRIPYDEENTHTELEAATERELDLVRRKYYQEKLDRLETKLHEIRGFKDRNEHEKERERRLLLSSYRRDTDMEMINSKQNTQTNYYNMPGQPRQYLLKPSRNEFTV